MRVQSSHLALRFYQHDGWTQDLLLDCLEEGSIEFCGGHLLNYWRSTINSRFNVKKLMPHVTEVIRWYDGDPRESDEEYIRSMNW